MMTKEQILSMGQALYQAFRTHQQVDCPSVHYKDVTYEEAYAIQRVMIEEMKKSGMTVSGKKVGLTSKAMRRVSGINEPDYGFIFSDLSYSNESEIPFGSFIAPRIECELAFKLKADLDKKDISMQNVLEATEYVVPCLEICDFRIYRDKVQRLITDSIADNAAFGGYVLGDKPIPLAGVDLSLVPFAFEVNNVQTEVSCGAAVYDDPALSVAWLANTFCRVGDPLRRGEWVLSGSAVASVPAKQGDHFRCRYGSLGEVSCKFV